VLNKAYRLAYFLHSDKAVATRIVAAATLKLNVAMAVQSKRLYYVPVGRFSPAEARRTDGIRNKALFSDLHLLQRLIYVESEPYERQKERAAQLAPPDVHAVGDPASDEDLLVYFTKHLVRITTKRNAFYVTLGVSRLLHSYSTLETMEIYNAVIGEPERVKDDYYYRSRKAVLMHEMSQRFGELIRACRQRRGEERFETRQGTSELRSLVKECLRLFTPWDTHCPVPRDFDPFNSVIAALTSKNGDDENRIEVNRIHAILHPNCFARLIAAFGYSPPEERIELPRFFVEQSDDQAPPRQRNAPADLSAEELAEISHLLDEQAGRRRRASSAGAVRILVDGIERGRFNPAEQKSISFTAEDDAELIEVKTMDPEGELLLATYLLSSFGEQTHEAPIVASIRLEGGQLLSLRIARQQSDANGGAGFVVQFSYRETNAWRAARLWWQGLGVRRSSEQRPGSLLGAPGFSTRYILAGTVLVIALISYLAYVRLRTHETPAGPAQINVVKTAPTNPSGTPEQVSAKVTKPGPQPITSAPPRSSVNGGATAAKTPVTSGAAAAANVTAQPRDEDVTGATRSGDVVTNLTLKDVKKVFVEMRGGAAGDELRSSLVKSLGSSGVVTATTDANEADAALKVTISPASLGGPQIEVSASLVNARGAVLWPRSSRGSSRGVRRYSGDTTKIVSEIVNELLSEIRQARGASTGP
jgi:hypothetical protein